MLTLTEHFVPIIKLNLTQSYELDIRSRKWMQSDLLNQNFCFGYEVVSVRLGDEDPSLCHSIV